ncbi:MAG TPA: hypothetical protein DEQ65_02570 [Ruminococcaceae bacterium]|nr:hypothetical protein [Oscillospiraceae bacterium]
MTWREGEWIAVHLTAFAMTKRLVILSAKHERIRFPFMKRSNCRAPFGARNDVEGGQTDCCTSNGVCSDKKTCHSECEARKNPFSFYEKERIAAHLSALAMTWRESKRIAVHLMAFAMAKRLVILSAKRERIRNTLKRVTDYSRLPIR